jgi:spore coat polysaccharide biosynthesis protein SpsF
MRIGIFVQVRLGSTRLARKALLPLAGSTVIGHVMRAMAGVPADVRALLTDPASLDELAPEAAACGFLAIAGHPEDVLARFGEAARRLDIQRVVRVTGDNPLTCPRLARGILVLHEARRAELSHFLGCPWGTGVEVIEAGALFAAESDAVRSDEREHLTTFMYRHPDRFRIVEEPAPPECSLSEARVTVDTPEDYARVCRIFADLYRGEPVESDAVVAWCRGNGRGAGAGG